MTVVARSANEAFAQILRELKTNSIESSPRGRKIKELINCNITIKNPRDRVVSYDQRKFSTAFAFGELCWYVNAKNDLKTMEYYSKFMKNCTDDGKTLNSAYGYRIFGRHEAIGFDQMANVVRLLSEDKDSRQAVIHLHTPNDKKTNDEVCTMCLQFLIRNDKLDMITTMRSNDLVLGFTYDVFAFTCLQELLANQLNVDVGAYYHNAGSMHIYENKFDLLDEVFKLKGKDSCEFEINVDLLNDIVYFESKVRNMFFEYEESSSTEAYIQSFIDTEMTAENLKNRDKTYKWVAVALVLKMLKEIGVATKSNRMLIDNFSNLIQILWDEELIREAQLLTNEFGSEKPLTNEFRSLIVEGPDRVGKSFLVNKMSKALAADEVLVLSKHYGFPGKAYATGAFKIYRNDLRSKAAKILDRSFLSDLVYAKVFKRRALISKAEKESLFTLLREENWGVKILLPSELNRSFWFRVRNEESKDVADKTFEIIKEYKFLAKELKDFGINVEISYVSD